MKHAIGLRSAVWLVSIRLVSLAAESNSVHGAPHAHQRIARKSFVPRNSSSIDIGVCWTRNEVQYDERVKHPPYGMLPSEFHEVYFALLSLRVFAPGVRSCLFTEPHAEAITWVLDEIGKTEYPASSQKSPQLAFDYVVQSAIGKDIVQRLVGVSTGAAMERLLGSKMAARQGINLWQKVKALVARIENLANSPFEITLFLDTDTALCPSTHLVAVIMAYFVRPNSPPVRVAELSSSKGKASQFNDSLRGEHAVAACVHSFCERDCWRSRFEAACVGCTVGCEHMRAAAHDDHCQSFRGRPVSLQVGAILLKRSNETRQFVNDWVAAYLDVFSLDESDSNTKSGRVIKNTYGNDQVPLNRIVNDHCRHSKASWRVAHLSNGFNCRLVTPTSMGIVLGRVYVIHQHNLGRLESKEKRGALHRIDKICSLLNAHLGLRLVSNAQINADEHSDQFPSGSVSVTVKPLQENLHDESERVYSDSSMAGLAKYAV